MIPAEPSYSIFGLHPTDGSEITVYGGTTLRFGGNWKRHDAKDLIMQNDQTHGPVTGATGQVGQRVAEL